ncbi:DUF29 domain-containing protein [Candidatus Albibeggiatoa sp. nov. BB20]|uniref:DUF29 domain-containing protein n=1 Tax=Candidatus Albibeggiatoa sp. nov. BB20 TaxID=3162723 RepID=UPI0033654930
MTVLKQEYDTNFESWVSQHIDLLKARQWQAVDVEHLIEELEGLAKRDRNELVSHLVILLTHLLKWQFQLNQLSEKWTEFTGKSWKTSIIEQRYHIQEQLDNYPSLKNYLADALIRAYPKAVSLAKKETGLSHFPQVCPYTIEQLLDSDFYPTPE